MEIGIALVFVVGSVLLLQKNKKHAITITIVYFLAVIYLTFLIREPTPTYRYSLRLFNAASRSLEFGGVLISGLLSGNIKTVGWSSLKGIVLNILLFIPFGYLIPAVWPKKKWSWSKIMLLGLAASFCVEIVQLVTRLGFADVDDLMNNSIGSGLGYLLYMRCLDPCGQRKLRISGKEDKRPHERINNRSGWSIRP